MLGLTQRFILQPGDLDPRQAEFGHNFRGNDVDITHFPFLRYLFVIPAQAGIQRYWREEIMIAIA